MLSRLPRRLLLPAVAGVLVMAACDDDDDPITPPPPPAATTDTFSATLASLNGGTATGTATFLVTEDDDELIAHVEVAGADTSTTLMQHVHVGGACPTATADTNADGFIDAVEAGAVSGLILVPLDADISTQSAGAGSYPSSDATGSYEYADTVSLAAVIADLTAADPDPNDLLAKLASGDIDINTRVVKVHGVADTVDLPASVLGLPGMTPQQSLPIACGPIQ